MIEILTKNKPYPNIQNDMEVAIEVSKNRLTHPIPSNCPPELEQILKKCWSFEPKGQISILISF